MYFFCTRDSVIIFEICISQKRLIKKERKRIFPQSQAITNQIQLGYSLKSASFCPESTDGQTNHYVLAAYKNVPRPTSHLQSLPTVYTSITSNPCLSCKNGSKIPWVQKLGHKKMFGAVRLRVQQSLPVLSPMKLVTLEMYFATEKCHWVISCDCSVISSLSHWLQCCSVLGDLGLLAAPSHTFIGCLEQMFPFFVKWK